MPTATLTIAASAYLLHMVRTTTIKVLTSEYVEMAALKRLSRSRVVFRHALPNIRLPTINIMALMLSGTLVVEVVFNYPGLGRGLADAVSFRDVPMIQAIALLWAIIYVFCIEPVDWALTTVDVIQALSEGDIESAVGNVILGATPFVSRTRLPTAWQ